jgi:hypothetical protein
MMRFEQFQSLIKTYSIEHKLVLHNDTTNVCFERFKTNQQLYSIPTNAGDVLVRVFDFVGRANGDFDSGQLKEQAVLHFMSRVDTSLDPYDAVHLAEVKAMEIMFDYYARMKYDQRTDSCGELKGFDLEDMTFEALEMQMEEHYGWMMMIPFREFAPAYDADKWEIA